MAAKRSSSLVRVTAPAKRNKTPAPRSKDPFEDWYAKGQVIPPPYNPLAIVALFDGSDVLQAAINAMEVNCGGFGLQFVPVDGEVAPEQQDAATDEQKRLARWFRYASARTLTWTMLMRKTRSDYELFGDAYWEMLRDANGKLVGLEHIRAYTMRKTRVSDPIEAERWVRDEGGAWTRVKYLQRFRSFVQEVGGSWVWFKEWGDPRKIRSDNGQVDDAAPTSVLATEVLNFCQYAHDHIYGKPRWRGAAADISGRTAAAEVNSDTFDNKGIPPAIITVAGGQLQRGHAQKVQQHFETLRGRENWHVPLIIEATAAETNETGDTTSAPVKIEVHDLTASIQKDALFTVYRKEAAKNVAMTFRLPPLHLGLSDDYTRATAEAAKDVAEEQVFAPERAEVDEVINREVMPELDARHWEVRTKSAPTQNEDTLLDAIRAGIEGGALSPAQVAKALEPLLGVKVERTEAYANIPSKVLDAALNKGRLPDELDGLGKATPQTDPVPATENNPLIDG